MLAFTMDESLPPPAQAPLKREIGAIEEFGTPKDSKRIKTEDAIDQQSGPPFGIAVENRPEAGTSTETGEKSKRRKKNKDARDGKKAERGSRRHASRPDGEEGPPKDPSALRLPKRRCALLIGFCGSGFAGMQMYVFDLSLL